MEITPKNQEAWINSVVKNHQLVKELKIEKKMSNINEKKMVGRQVLYLKKVGEPIVWADIKHVDFQDGDIISSRYMDYSFPNVAIYVAEVMRMELESDEAHQKRLAEYAKYNEAEAKEREEYLRLKKKFDK